MVPWYHHTDPLTPIRNRKPPAEGAVAFATWPQRWVESMP
jgi:hypothetical protein